MSANLLARILKPFRREGKNGMNPPGRGTPANAGQQGNSMKFAFFHLMPWTDLEETPSE